MIWLEYTLMVIMIFIAGGGVIAIAKMINDIYKPFRRLYKELENKLTK